MFYKNLMQLCRQNKTVPSAVVKELGFSSSMPTAWKKGAVPKADTLQKIADYFGVTTDALLKATEDAPAKSMTVDRKTYGRVKIVSQVAAGIPIEAIDVFDPDDPDDWEELEASLLKSGEYFGLRVHGDSMLPDFKDGDIVIVRKQETAEEGEIVVVTVNGEVGTVKKIHYRGDGITLLSLNPDYPPIKYTAEQCRDLPILIAGKVVQLHRNY